MTLGLGIIGAGGVAALHAEAAASAGLRIAGVCDVREERADALAARYPGAAAMGSAEALLEMPEVAAVVVAVPNALHQELAVAAMHAGKDVLLEKPMAVSPAECDEIIDVMQATRRVLQMGFVCRAAPASEAARRLIESGRLGRIYHAKASLYRRRGIPGLGRWFTTRARSGGGVLMDLGVHMVDLVLHLNGFPEPRRASAVCTSTFGTPIDQYRFEEMWGGPPDPDGVFDVEDAATALVRFDGGMSLELNVTWAADIPDTRLGDHVVLLGDKGGVWFDLWKNEMVVTTERAGEPVDTPEPLPDCEAWPTAWKRQADTFARNVADRSLPEASAEKGRAVQVLIDALYRSAAEEREVEVGT